MFSGHNEIKSEIKKKKKKNLEKFRNISVSEQVYNKRN